MTGEAVSRSVSLLSRLLRYGDAATRQRLADDVASGDAALAHLLASTARSDEAQDLRVRCVEVLGLALEDAGNDVREDVLASLFGI